MLNMLKKHHKEPTYKIKAVDSSGNEQVFCSAKDLAAFFDVTRSAVYMALNKSLTLRGCRLYKIDEWHKDSTSSN